MFEERNRILAELIAGIDWRDVQSVYEENNWNYCNSSLFKYIPSTEDLQTMATRLLHVVAHGGTRFIACGQMEVYRAGYVIVLNIGNMACKHVSRHHSFEQTGGWEFEFETNIP